MKTGTAYLEIALRMLGADMVRGDPLGKDWLTKGRWEQDGMGGVGEL